MLKGSAWRRAAWGAAMAIVAVVGLGAASPTGPLEVRPPRAASQPDSLVAQTLRAAEEQGFAPGEFPPGQAGVLAYARAQHGARLPRAAFPAYWALRPPPFDEGQVAAGLAAGDSASWLAALPPPDPRYARLVSAYGRYRGIAALGGWPTLANASPLSQGDVGPAVDALRVRLAVEDPQLAQQHITEDADGRSHFDATLAAAVIRAQERYGLTADGRVGPATLAALNVPVEGRLRQIRANLERWRWAPRSWPATRIELNTADATLELHDVAGGSMAMRAIVGRSSLPTPMFADKVRAVVFNPPWNVPQSIAAKEIWPRIRRDPGYMAREGFVVRPGGGLQQRPGPKCALGMVKFELDNPFGVYLHDTPARSLFALNQRALSHGCMRLEQPTDLAKRLLAGDPDWPETAINLVLLSGKTTRAPLRRPVPVYVLYWTAFVAEDNQIQFRRDVYGWDAKLAQLMKAAGHTL